MDKKDVTQVHKLLNTYIANFSLKLKLSVQDITHLLLPREGVIQSYVVENAEQKQITDFISFYSLPSSILKTVGHSYEKVNVILCLF